MSVRPGLAFVGEVGLGGELRGGGLRIDLRVQEALRMGFKSVVVPESSSEGLDKFKQFLIPCRTLLSALESSLDISSNEIALGKKKGSQRTGNRRKQSNYASTSDDEARRINEDLDEALISDYDSMDSFE